MTLSHIREAGLASQYGETEKYFNYSYEMQVGFLIHEVTHKCGTNDEDGDKSPRDVNGKRWSSIADTYRWYLNGVCLPGVDYISSHLQFISPR